MKSFNVNSYLTFAKLKINSDASNQNSPFLFPAQETQTSMNYVSREPVKTR